MKLAMIGLGRMGGNMAERLLQHGHQVVVFDPSDEARQRLAKMGGEPAESLAQAIEKLSAPRIVWVMVPAGKITEDTIQTLIQTLNPGDIIIDGGNSNFHDSVRRGKEAQERGVHFIDAGTSGGVWGLTEGYCLMVGGPDQAVHTAEPIFTDLAPENGYLHVGPVGSGHFVKMVHNGIEYGLLQAYGEGFEILKASDFPIDLPKVAELWNHGSVVRSWLLELLAGAYRENPTLEHVRGYVDDSGEGRWTVFEAINENVPAPVITLSLFSRFASRQEESYSAKVIAALRNQFGGHKIHNE
ncbi:phosphogluconate dehydrogenase (NAD(+)-dependent, decarboxylating) [Sulfobacillus harzensis]|uniref:Decarboxylating 6-phosphogluconate dehydrogenase n=1 Tax=Sulfobacillus harzensis TaxID=2729629 RepID=A0A7Y0Q257_9FIRM|nr:decarboxylating 6-phosphogluconate dehydrogenase [Sulfobacillus harzensis]NMP22833.1 decarboxylating 6-phosphogluconate dehydrogenase [Sulfobacillus harzensis]